MNFENDVIIFSILLVVMKFFIGILRKRNLFKMGLNAMMLFDIIAINLLLLLYISYNSNIKELKDDFCKLSLFDYFFAFLACCFVALSIIIGRQLLLKYSFPKLKIVFTIINILMSVLLSYFIYNDKITFNKMFGFIFVIVGAYLINL